MEDAFKCTVFGHDLMNHTVTLYQTSLYQDIRNQIGESPFRDSTGDAIACLKDHNLNEHQLECCRLVSAAVEVIDIGKYCMTYASNYFQENGYTPENFLEFCARLVFIADHYNVLGTPGVVELLADIVSSTLSSFVLTGKFKQEGGWNALDSAAKTLINEHDEAQLQYESEEVAELLKEYETLKSQLEFYKSTERDLLLSIGEMKTGENILSTKTITADQPAEEKKKSKPRHRKR